jgi:hypothetical protein
MVEVKVAKTRSGVFIYFSADYIKRLFNNTVPEYITMLCGGHVVQARFSLMNGSTIRYRVYSRYVPILLRHDDCYLVVEQKA